ncbi:TonB-dependent receptor [Labilibacter sediminis]|nr:TonB-dependent receptor [Labilibacter sediminis]
MNFNFFAFSVILILMSNLLCSAGTVTTKPIQGKVTCNNQPVPYANIIIKNTTIGSVTNVDGTFTLDDIPLGDYTIIAKALGYKTTQQTVTLGSSTNLTLNFHLEEDILGIEQVVITADRNEKKRTEASSIVNTLTPKQLDNIQAVVLSDGLNYLPGLRTETNCQNCGMVAVRMNGLPGDYSQILINSRPIFSGLVGVYGLELFPVSMIDRLEVIRGGGSALYGSNAIAGTINIITKEPVNNSYQVQAQTGAIGVIKDANAAQENVLNFNTSIVSPDKNTGLAIYGTYRDRDYFDANGDGYSELMKLNNMALGSRLTHRINYKNKIVLDYFMIDEKRRGGNEFDNLYHETDLTEAVHHKITTGALTHEYFIGSTGTLSSYVSAQAVDRDSYYGAEKSLADYGNTKGLTYTIGSQYKGNFGKNTLIASLEIIGDLLKDKKLGYPDYSKPVYDEGEIIGFEHFNNSIVAHQDKYIYGGFFQFNYAFNKLKLSAGARVDHYNIKDLVNGTGNTSGTVFSPRFSALYNARKNLQIRGSYSQGYRAPQIFDEDLHISASGSRQVAHRNAAGLKQETSHSFMLSADYNGLLFGRSFSILGETFYTFLNDAFSSTPGEVDENGLVTYYRENVKGAAVQGINLEANISIKKNLIFNMGYTIQQSEYEEPQELGEKSFLRTPDHYGFFTLDWDINKKWCFVTTGQYTGSMKIAYYNQSNDDGAGEIRNTQQFFDMGVKLEYKLNISKLPLKLFAGTRNIFNSFQTDFEVGTDRDPTYIYGPSLPRMIYLGLKISDLY